MRLDAVGVLFANSWRRLQERFAVVVPIFLVPLVLIGISQLLILQQKPATLILGGVINILSVIVSLFASIALISAFGKGTNFGTSYQAGAKLFWSWAWMGILSTLAIVGGFVMFIIPGIMLEVQLALAGYVLVFEGKRGMAALVQSREYVKGYWWAFFGRSILLLLCLLPAYFILFLPATLIFGRIVGGLVYGIILLIFTPFSLAYYYEMYENFRRLKPDVTMAAQKAETGFLKVSMVVGVITPFALVVLICAALIVLPGALVKWQAAYPNGYTYGIGYGYPPAIGTSTMQITPTSGSVGSMVTVSGAGFDATNTILMRGLLAARDVSPSVDGTLTFTVPSSLAPNCDPHEACPQFLLTVTPGDYEVTIMNSRGATSVGTFTVTGTPPGLPGGLK